MTAKSSKGERKRLREQETVSMMIRLYCRKNHWNCQVHCYQSEISVYGSAPYVVYPERENEGGKTP